MQLIEIKKYLKNIKIYNNNNKNIKFSNLQTNSKNISKNSIFLINNKKKIKDYYLMDAIKKGAVAILTNKLIHKLNFPQIITEDINRCLLILLNKLKPIKPKNFIAITGTNGKTSVSWYISQLFYINDFPIKYYGTLGYYINGKKKRESFLTTPENEILYQNAFLKKNNKYCFVCEASSHALDQNRLRNLPINIAAITNITQDHYDYHKNFTNYKNAKIKLLTKFLKKNGYAVLNDNIKNINFLKKKLLKKYKIITFGKIFSDIYLHAKKNLVNINVYKEKYEIKLTNISKIELENISCAIACCLCAGMKTNLIIKNLKKILNVPGRLELVKNDIGYKVYIDYAHTPDALKNVLIAKTINSKKPNLVFGCGGNRDIIKRKRMGLIANKYANKVYITNDNPRNEDEHKIRKSIIKYCPKATEIASRKSAINIAVKNLNKNDILIVAGKGHEKEQIIKSKVIPFNDYNISQNALKKRSI